MSDKLRVLQVIPSLEIGGAERTTIEVAQAITLAGGRALVASQGGRLEPDLVNVGGELIRMPLDSKNPLTLMANAQRLTHTAQSRGMRLIHARSRAPAWSALLAARRARLPFVTTYHGIYSANGPLKRWYNSVMAKGDLVIANSEFTRGHVLSMYETDPAKVIAIPRAVDIDVFDETPDVIARGKALRAQWNVPEGRAVAIVPARLSRWKGQDLLIDAAALVEARLPGHVFYVLAGDAQGRESYVADLDKAIDAVGLSAVIKRVGHVSDMPAAFAASDFAIFPPTNLEAFGRGAIEAQAMGIPVIAADQGGFTETVIDRETGLLFEMGEAEALANAIVTLARLSHDSRRAMGEKGRTRTRSLYSKASLQQATLEIYARLLQDKPA